MQVLVNPTCNSYLKMARLSLLDRARAIGHIQAGTPKTHVAEMFGVNLSTIKRLCRRFQETAQVKDRQRSGRPKKTTENDDRRIRLTALRQRTVTARKLQANLRRQNIIVSDQTIRRRLHARGLKARTPAKKPFLRDNHRHQRLAWCRQHRHWNVQQWRNVLFTDESRFCLRKGDGREKVWRRQGERYTDSCIARKTAFNGGGVMVWGGICSQGKTQLVVVNGNMNAVQYQQQILDPVAIPYLRTMGNNAIFQDDNARPHRARLITDHLAAENIERMDWPACSPDLNPIEMLWDQLGRAVRQRITRNSTIADLRHMLIEEWNAIPQDRIQRLVRSMRRRCVAVIQAAGGSTRY